MSNSGISNPLGVNALGALLQSEGININPTTAGYIGTSSTPALQYYTYGTLISSTVLKNLTNAIHQGWVRYNAGDLSLATYQNLIAIGAGVIPALGNSPPSTYQNGDWSGLNYSGQTASYGYIRLFAWQAFNEIYYNTTSLALSDFLGSFQQASSFINQSNQVINSVANSRTFLQGTYSNMNDLVSADITGVSLSTKNFGTDLLNLGKTLDLSTISSFGLPSNLLATIRKYNGLTASLKIALLASGLTTQEINNVTTNSSVTKLQQQQIYASFLIIKGVDLFEITQILNCKTSGLITLADLLNPKMMFPKSYMTLTVPVYNSSGAAQPTNSKTYYPIYLNTGVNSALTSAPIKAQIGTLIVPGPAETGPRNSATSTTLQILPIGFDSYLREILPTNIAVAAGAFGITMQQIRQIQDIAIENFSQIVSNIETIQGLNLINGTSVPTDTTLSNSALGAIGKGSGTNGTYTYSDFFGCMSGLSYQWGSLLGLLQVVQTTALATIYSNLYAATQNPVTGSTLDTLVQTQINLANIEIASIKITKAAQVTQLNSLYDSTGTQLSIEQLARHNLSPLPDPIPSYIYPYPTIVYSFVDSVPTYAKDTAANMAAATLEAISNLTLIGGQSIVGLMRQERNQDRLNLVGIELDNNISTFIATPNQLTATIIQNIPGSLNNPINIVPPNLDTTVTNSVLLNAQPTIAQAIDDVIACNCDCWVQ
jgi:hypothetical protein